MFAVQFVDTGQAAQPFVLALRTQADHYDLFLGVRGTFLAEIRVLLESHPDIIKTNIKGPYILVLRNNQSRLDY